MHQADPEPHDRGFTATTARRSLLKGAGGMALGALGLGGTTTAAQNATPAARVVRPRQSERASARTSS